MLLTMALSIWVTIMNPEGVSNSNTFKPFWDTCVVTSLRQTFPVAPYDETHMLYRVIEDERVGGSRCGAGTLFLMTPAAWEKQRAEEDTYEEQRAKDRERMQEILRQRTP